MTENPKKTGFGYVENYPKKDSGSEPSHNRVWTLLRHTHTLLPMLSGALQIFVGLVLVSITILGLIEPLWLSAVLSILGSILTMAGVFLIYNTITKQGSFDGLLNQAIRRVINSQN